MAMLALFERVAQWSRIERIGLDYSSSVFTKAASIATRTIANIASMIEKPRSLTTVKTMD